MELLLLSVSSPSFSLSPLPPPPYLCLLFLLLSVPSPPLLCPLPISVPSLSSSMSPLPSRYVLHNIKVKFGEHSNCVIPHMLWCWDQLLRVTVKLLTVNCKTVHWTHNCYGSSIISMILFNITMIVIMKPFIIYIYCILFIYIASKCSNCFYIFLVYTCLIQVSGGAS